MSEAELQQRMEYISELKAAILRLHGCESEFAGSEDVIETFQGETVWSGRVEIFNIRGHPKATRAYGWGHATGEHDQGRRYIAVLELPPVDSPQTAVRAAIMSEIKNAKRKA